MALPFINSLHTPTLETGPLPGTVRPVTQWEKEKIEMRTQLPVEENTILRRQEVKKPSGSVDQMRSRSVW